MITYRLRYECGAYHGAIWCGRALPCRPDEFVSRDGAERKQRELLSFGQITTIEEHVDAARLAAMQQTEGAD